MITFKQFIAEQREVHGKKIADAPDWVPAHAVSHYKIGAITFSSTDGVGAVPINANIWYEGFVCLMKPSTFLTIALSDDGHQDGTAKELEKIVADGYAIGPPFLEVLFDEDGNELPKCQGHEGRGRMKMVRNILGDVPIPVHIKLRGGMRSRHLTKEMIDEFKQGVYAERSTRLVKDPTNKVWVDYRQM